MRVRIGTIVKIAVVLVIALFVAVFAILKSVDFNQYKGLVAQKVEEATGRKLTIAGDVHLNIFTLTPGVAVDNVTFANAPWGTRPDMLKLKRLDVQVALLPLLSKQIEVKRLVLVSPDILLETNAKGEGNWVFSKAAPAAQPAKPAPASGAPAALPIVNKVSIQNGVLTYIDGVTHKKTVLDLDNLSAQANSSSSPLTIAVNGKYNGNPFSIDGTVGPMGELQAPSKPYPVDITAEAGGAKVKLSGTIAKPMQAKGFNLDVSVNGSNVADLGALTGSAMPKIGPYSLAAHLGEAQGGIKVEHLKAALGKSDLAGDALLLQGKTPTLKGTFSSKLIDLAELSAAAGGGAKAAEKPAAPSGGGKGGGKLFSDAPLKLDGLKAANADVKLSAQTVKTPNGVELHNVVAGLALNNGLLTLKPVTADMANGKLSADVVVDARQPQAGVTVDAKANNIDLGALVKEMKINQKIEGKANFDSAIKGSGSSVHGIMAGLNGHTDFAMGESHIDNTYMKILFADLAKAVIGGGDASKINCVLSHFDINKGVAVSKALIMDTDTVTMRGSGDINLGTEQIDMVLTPDPKEVSLVNLAIPVKITGPLTSPSFVPDAAAVAKKAGEAVIGTMTGGAAGALLGPLLGGGESGSSASTQPASGPANPCEALASGKPVKTAPAKPAAATKPAQSPAEKATEGAGKALEGVGKTLKGLF